MKKNKATEANRDFWNFVEETSDRVRQWPSWMRGDSHYGADRTQNAEKGNENDTDYQNSEPPLSPRSGVARKRRLKA